jgi:hypothetical protein
MYDEIPLHLPRRCERNSPDPFGLFREKSLCPHPLFCPSSGPVDIDEGLKGRHPASGVVVTQPLLPSGPMLR